jgi:CubicO group peptidase (beta-lactamase class C family)
MKRFLYLFLIVLVSFTELAAQSQESLRIDSLMRIAHQRGIFNGNILVASKGKIIYRKSFGFADGGKTMPLSMDLKFGVGSISKEFNGVAIMLLNEQGKLSLDDNLLKYFPEFPAWANEVKVKHLINYSSGIPVLGPAADGNDSLIYASLVNLKNLTAKPGTLYIYNHINVSLQRRIIGVLVMKVLSKNTSLNRPE